MSVANTDSDRRQTAFADGIGGNKIGSLSGYVYYVSDNYGITSLNKSSIVTCVIIELA